MSFECLFLIPSSEVTGAKEGTMLPWGAHKERSPYPTCVNVDINIRPGEFVMRTLFAEFTIQAEKKIESVMGDPPVGFILIYCVFIVLEI